MKKKIYIHDIPGRLRIHVKAIKNNERTAAAIRDLVAAIPGAVSVRTNTLAGSITVTYNTDRLTSTAILSLLRQNGYLDVEPRGSERSPLHSQPSVARNLLTEVVAPKVGQMVLGWIVERALVAAVAALL